LALVLLLLLLLVIKTSLEVLWSSYSDEVEEIAAIAATKTVEAGFALGFLYTQRALAVI
jgi:hypothetical protein